MGNYYMVTDQEYNNTGSLLRLEDLRSTKCSILDITPGSQVPTELRVTRGSGRSLALRNAITRTRKVDFWSKDVKKIVGSTPTLQQKACSSNQNVRTIYTPMGGGAYYASSFCACPNDRGQSITPGVPRGSKFGRFSRECGPFGPNNGCCMSPKCEVLGDGSASGGTTRVKASKYPIPGRPGNIWIRKPVTLPAPGGLILAFAPLTEMRAQVGKNWGNFIEKFKTTTLPTPSYSVGATLDLTVRISGSVFKPLLDYYGKHIKDPGNPSTRRFRGPIFRIDGGIDYKVNGEFSLATAMLLLGRYDDVTGWSSVSNANGIIFSKGNMSIGAGSGGMFMSYYDDITIKAGQGALVTTSTMGFNTDVQGTLTLK